MPTSLPASSRSSTSASRRLMLATVTNLPLKSRPTDTVLTATAISESPEVSLDTIKTFEEKYQLTVLLSGLYATDHPSKSLVSQLVSATNTFFTTFEALVSAFKFCCLSRQKHKTIEVIGLLLCDIEQVYTILEYFAFITKHQDEAITAQLIGLKDNGESVHHWVLKMLKYAIFPPIDPKFIKQNIYNIANGLTDAVLEVVSYLVQRLLVVKQNTSLLQSYIAIISSVVQHSRRKFEITLKLELWLDEHSTCTKCTKQIQFQPCVKELQTGLKWHLDCCFCANCQQRLFKDHLMYAALDSTNNNVTCSSCNLSSNTEPEQQQQQLRRLRFDQFKRISMRMQSIALLKIKILETVQELEDENYGYICQEWVHYWRMDNDDLRKFDRTTQKIQSAIFELIHRQQFFVDSATDFLRLGDKFLKDAMELQADLQEPNTNLHYCYDVVFKPVKELRKIHKRLLLSPMTRFLSDQGMVVKNLIFKLYLNWINKSYFAYENYLVNLAESELMLVLDKAKPQHQQHLLNWIKRQKSAKLEKLILGEFYYQIIQTKEILKNIESNIDHSDPENAIILQTSSLIDKYSFTLHAVLDRAVTRSYLSRIQNLEVKRQDVHYKKHAFVRYKSKVTGEVVDCCLILLNMCLVITKLGWGSSVGNNAADNVGGGIGPGTLVNSNGSSLTLNSTITNNNSISNNNSNGNNSNNNGSNSGNHSNHSVNYNSTYYGAFNNYNGNNGSDYNNGTHGHGFAFIKFAPLIYVENLEYEQVDAKLFISDKTKRDMEPYKVHFKSEDEAATWVNINI